MIKKNLSAVKKITVLGVSVENRIFSFPVPPPRKKKRELLSPIVIVAILSFARRLMCIPSKFHDTVKINFKLSYIHLVDLNFNLCSTLFFLLFKDVATVNKMLGNQDKSKQSGELEEEEEKEERNALDRKDKKKKKKLLFLIFFSTASSSPSINNPILMSFDISNSFCRFIHDF